MLGLFSPALAWAIVLAAVAMNGRFGLTPSLVVAGFLHFLLLSVRDTRLFRTVGRWRFAFGWILAAVFAGVIAYQYFLFGQASVDAGHYTLFAVALAYEVAFAAQAFGYLVLGRGFFGGRLVLALLGLSLLTPFLYVLSNGSDALHELAAHGQIKAIRYLVAAGYDVDDVNEYGCTPLLTAVHRKQGAAVIDELITLGAIVDYADERCGPALYDAVASEQVDTVNLLLTHGADADLVGPDGLAPLLLAAKKADPQIVYALLMNDADPLMTDSDGNTALHMLLLGEAGGVTDCRLSLVDEVTNIAQNLINKGADRKQQNRSGQDFDTLAKDFCDGDVLKNLDQ